jgi:hypothetical protein
MLMAAPPVVAGTLFSVVWTVVGRAVFAPSEYSSEGQSWAYHLFLWVGGIVIWLAELVATMIVMGGASRNFVRHLLFGEPITVRETYRNAARRFAGLLAASSLLGGLLGFLGIVFFYAAIIAFAIAIAFIVFLFGEVPFVAVIAAIAAVAGIGYIVLWLYFLIASRFAYVPQVMLVEELGVFSAISRSANLASGNVRRLMALWVFTFFATLAALALLYVPLTWYAWFQGVDLFGSRSDILPAWLEIGYSLIWQISFILLSPVLMIGLCLLYVDERVRSEGFDIELMAAREFGEMPAVPAEYVNPLQPALVSVASESVGGNRLNKIFRTPAKGGSILNLK